jgi:hypothetical protein
MDGTSTTLGCVGRCGERCSCSCGGFVLAHHAQESGRRTGSNRGRGSSGCRLCEQHSSLILGPVSHGQQAIFKGFYDAHHDCYLITDVSSKHQRR